MYIPIIGIPTKGTMTMPNVTTLDPDFEGSKIYQEFSLVNLRQSVQLLNRAHAQRLADEVRHGFARQKFGLIFVFRKLSGSG